MLPDGEAESPGAESGEELQKRNGIRGSGIQRAWQVLSDSGHVGRWDCGLDGCVSACDSVWLFARGSLDHYTVGRILCKWGSAWVCRVIVRGCERAE